MKVCIVGGGNIGTTLACYIKYTNPSKCITLLTRRPKSFSQKIECSDWERKKSYSVSLDCISGDPLTASAGADIVFVALPHFAVEKAFRDIAPYVSEKAFIGVLPGGGGCEFFFGKYFSPEQTLFGFQRVPFTAKLEEYGLKTNLKSWKPYSVVGTQKRDRIDEVCDRIESCGLKTKKADNYLSVALTPTNPILHTTRIYEIFGRYDRDHVFSQRSKFYVGWTDEASRTLLTLDIELRDLLSHITELDTCAIRPLTEHYEASTVESMTKRINSIATFQSVYAPLRPAENEPGFIADTDSRMFTEDFPWGLAIIRSYCDLFGTKAPRMDEILKWYAEYMGISWYKDGKFLGRDLKDTGVPQRYGIRTRKELLSYYIQ